MSAFDRPLLAEKLAALNRHLQRVAAKLPATPAELTPNSDATDAVVLHLWQAVQLTMDVAIASVVALHLGTPPTYGDAFRMLATAGHLDPALAERLVRAVGLRNIVAHAYETLDLERVHAAAMHGPADLRAFFGALGKVARTP